jgi:hypothetical protein
VQRLEALLRRTQGQLAATSDQLAAVTTERDNLRRAYRQLMEQFELLRRRIFVAKAERVDATQLELEFEQTKQKLDELVAKLGGSDVVVAGASAADVKIPQFRGHPKWRDSAPGVHHGKEEAATGATSVHSGVQGRGSPALPSR